MAHQILALQRLTDYDKNTTVNVGVIKGGTASNVVPAACEVELDFRITLHEEAERLEQAIHNLRPVLEGTKLLISGGLNRPPMVRDERMIATFEKAKTIAARHGMALQEGSAGGASDGNFTASITPTLDGLGADGDGAHAVHEHVLINTLSQRAALVAALLSEW
jgi:glutamate carboxypeptidase